jgi:hypothetical protein
LLTLPIALRGHTTIASLAGQLYRGSYVRRPELVAAPALGQLPLRRAKLAIANSSQSWWFVVAIASQQQNWEGDIMRNRILNGLVLTIAGSLAGCSATQIATPPPPEIAVVEKQDTPERLERTAAVKITAVVTDIDVANRLVTLKDSDGNEETIQVGPEVRNLPQVKKGDEVVVTYYESTVFQLHKPGQAKPGAGSAEVAARAEPGEKPGAVGAEAMTIVATVTKVNKTGPKPSITLKSKEGKVVTLPVRDASRLAPVKVGDLLEITYKQALAVEVETPSKK